MYDSAPGESHSCPRLTLTGDGDGLAKLGVDELPKLGVDELPLEAVLSPAELDVSEIDTGANAVAGACGS